MTNHKQTLLEKINTRQAKVAVIGLGYVGLPLAVEFAKAGFTTVGIDLDRRKVEAIRLGQSYIQDVATSEVAAPRPLAHRRLAGTAPAHLLRRPVFAGGTAPVPGGEHRRAGFVGPLP